MPFKPQGALKLLLFRLPKDIQKANDKMVSFFFFFFACCYSLSLCCKLSGRYGLWQTGLVTCSKSVRADCTGLIWLTATLREREGEIEGKKNNNIQTPCPVDDEIMSQKCVIKSRWPPTAIWAFTGLYSSLLYIGSLILQWITYSICAVWRFQCTELQRWYLKVEIWWICHYR